MRDFAEVFDYYQAAVYDRAALADSIAAVLRGTGSVRVLDCACGTGLPGIDLRAMGFDIDCCDADAAMLTQFRRNAVSGGVDDKARQLSWSWLPVLGPALRLRAVPGKFSRLRGRLEWRGSCRQP